MPIPWDPIYSVHIEVIDRQHRRFVEIINELDDAIQNNRVKEEMGTIFDELIAYAKIHFGTEEMYFEKFQYEHSAEHIVAHSEFVDEINALRERYGKNEYQLSRDLIEYLHEWLTKHLAYMDKEYVKCFHEHGLR